MKNILLITSVLLVNFVLGQNFSITDSAYQGVTDPAAALRHVIQPLDKQSITSGLLFDAGLPLIGPVELNGSDSSYIFQDWGDWSRAYNLVFTMALDSAQALAPIANWEDLLHSELLQGNVAISSVHFNFQRFLEDSAQLAQLIYESNGQLYDYPNQASSPYVTQSLFGAAPFQSIFFDTLQASFILKQEFLFDNLPETLSLIEVDFDNGQGWQSLSLGEPISVSWQEYGEKTLKIRFTYNSNLQVISRSKIKLIDTKTKAAGTDDFFGYDDVADEEFRIQSGRSANYGARVQIEFGCGNREITKPIIFLEGFNPTEFYSDWPRGLDITDFWDRMIDYQDEFVNQAPNSFNLLQNLEDQGYDIIYVDWDEGAGDIRENAYVAMAVINAINQRKAANNSAAPTILWGNSMGGLVGRYGLLTMENENTPHDVSYFISFDAPQRGANVPYAFQRLIQNVRNFKFWGNHLFRDIKEVNDAWLVLHKTGTRQMLAKQLPGNSLFDDLQQDLANLGGMPSQTLQNIAIANGNGQGVGQGFAAGSKMIDINLNSFNALHSCTGASGFWSWMAGLGALLLYGSYADLDIEVHAMPAYNTQLQQYLKVKIIVYVGLLPLKIEDHEYYISHSIPLDNAQGGIYELDGVIDINDLPCGPPGVQVNTNTFCFIPTYSALNILPTNTGQGWNVNEVYDEANVVAMNRTDFDETHLINNNAYLPQVSPDNENHVSITPSNVDVFEGHLFNFDNGINNIVTPSPNQLISLTYNMSEAVTGNQVERTTDRINENLSISGSPGDEGKLCINCNDRIGFVNDVNNPVSTASAFSVKTGSGCLFGRITVESSGILEIGYSSSKTGTLIITEFTELNVKSGGIIRIHDNSKIIIEDGGSFIFENGASLELIGDNSEIIIKGKLEVAANTSFTFTGNGQIVFDQDISYVPNGSGHTLPLDDYFDIGTGATLDLSNPSSADINDVLLKCSESLYMRMENNSTFAEVNISNGTILLNESKMMFSYSPTKLSYVKITSPGPNKKHAGFRIWNPGFGSSRLWHCDISDGNIGVLAHWIGGGLPLSVQHCTFSNNSTGLKVSGGNVSVLNTSFTLNDWGVYGQNLSGTSSFSGITINGRRNNIYGSGLFVSGQEGSFVTINNSLFDECYKAVQSEGTNIRSSCSNYERFQDVGFEMDNAILYMNENAGNEFTNISTLAIKLTGEGNASGIYLEEGHNYFNNWQMSSSLNEKYIIGFFDNDPPQSSYFTYNTSTNQYVINAD